MSGGMNPELVSGWRPEPVEDECTPDLAVGAAAAGLWGTAAPVAVAPPMWHWFHFVEWTPRHLLGADGHPADGHFLPPVPDRRRMFAGGTCTLHRPVAYGEPVRRRRTMLGARLKDGRTGTLLFVTVRSELYQSGQLCLVEDQDIVYRSGPGDADRRGVALATTGPDIDPDSALPLVTDPPLLMRMSALTGNQHRIHYDNPYATEVEHYPALVVHGPLLVLHMLELPRRALPGRTPTTISYRLHSPVYVGEPLAAVAEPGNSPPLSLRVATARDARHASVELRWDVLAAAGKDHRP